MSRISSASRRPRNPGTFLYNTGPITSEGSSAWNRPQTYTITRVMGGTATRLDDADYTTPVNIGPRSTPNYHDLEMANINPLSNGGRAFVGQRDDPFFVDTAAIFDLGGLRPFNAAHLIPSGGAQPGGCGRTANGSKQKPNGVYCRSFKWGALRCRAASGPREQAIVDRTPREGEFRGGLSQWHREVSTSSEESPQLFEFGVCAPSASVTDWA
jgi:hypothetical protein